jgi:hypothetical protein
MQSVEFPRPKKSSGFPSVKLSNIKFFRGVFVLLEQCVIKDSKMDAWVDPLAT